MRTLRQTGVGASKSRPAADDRFGAAIPKSPPTAIGRLATITKRPEADIRAVESGCSDLTATFESNLRPRRAQEPAQCTFVQIFHLFITSCELSRTAYGSARGGNRPRFDFGTGSGSRARSSATRDPHGRSYEGGPPLHCGDAELIYRSNVMPSRPGVTR